MKELETVKLENERNYVVLNEINNYVYLVNPEDELDFCIRKCIIKNGKEYIESLDDEIELLNALRLFAPNE